MSNKSKSNPKLESRPTGPKRKGTLIWGVIAGAVVLAAAAAVLLTQKDDSTASKGSLTNQTNSPQTPPAPSPLVMININRALIVTVELDFGPTVPSIAEALREVERRYQPDDGHGRTFAVLDAYGEPTPSGKLHMSMHVSTEKPGIGTLVFRRTGEVLWQSRI